MNAGHKMHWLERAVRQNFPVECPGDWGIDPSTPPADAWVSALRGCSLSPEQIAQSVALTFKVSVADFGAAEPTAQRFVSAESANEWLVFPLKEAYRDIVVATCDPTNVEVEQALAFASGRSVRFAVADPGSLTEAIGNAYAPNKLLEGLIGGVEHEEADFISVLSDHEEDHSDAVDEDEEDGAPVVRLANIILKDALNRGASDIHLQPSEKVGLVRFRVDGTLRTYMKLPEVVMPRIASRIKVIGGLDISDRLRPQDGKARIVHQGKRYDLRISTVPTRGSEKVVIRVLDTEGAPALSEIGFRPQELSRFHSLLGQREGIVLVTGPTGSGKTTTLYAALKELAQEDVNIMTVEDPVEYDLPGITQIQVNNKQRVTFASALRAILRQDPDIILVGEIRDLETAEMAVQAAMTGHVVLATLHTNDAAGSIRRLKDIGLPIASIADSLRGAVAQRLARRVCSECAEPVDPNAMDEAEAALFARYSVLPKVRAVGCDACESSGYRGRIPINEVLILDENTQTTITSGASTAAVRKAGQAAGMRLLRECALDLIVDGITTVDEIRRVLGEDLTSSDSEEGEASATQPDAPEPVEGPNPAPGVAPAPPVSAPLALNNGAPLEAHTDVAFAAPASNGARGTSTPPAPLAPSPDEPSPFEEDASDRRRALVVDDDATTRLVVRGLLESMGLEVHEVGDGIDAIKLLKADPLWDLMLLDLDMPLLDGRDVLRVVRASVSTAALPVVVLTGSPDPNTESEVLELGADDYIRKPIEPVQVLGRVKATLRRSAVYAEAT